MKRFYVTILIAALLIPATAPLAQSQANNMKTMDMGKGQSADAATHTAVGTVKKVDAKAGTVTLDHEPVKTLKWPAMTMGFKVSEKSLLDKLPEGRKVEIEFKQVGKDYVVTSVK